MDAKDQRQTKYVFLYVMRNFIKLQIIKKAKIGQILDVTNNILYILLLNQFIPDIIASRQHNHSDANKKLH